MISANDNTLSEPLAEQLPAPRVSVIRPPGFSLSKLLNDLYKLVQYRDLLFALTIHRINVRYKQSVLGLIWAILQPMSMMFIFTFIFSTIAHIKSEGVPYAIFAYIALLPWNCFSTGVTNATNSLVAHSQFVSKVYFPREILPITYVFAAVFDFAVGSIVLAGLMIYYKVQLTFTALYALPIVLLLIVFETGMAFLLSVTQVRIRDVGVAIPLLLQLWMFATPVIYPLSAVPEQFRTVYMLNPMVGIVDNIRATVLRGNPPELKSLAFSVVVSIVLLTVSYLYFKRVEATMADFI